MGLLDNIKSAVGEENFQKIESQTQSYMSQSGEKKEQAQAQEQAGETKEQVKESASKTVEKAKESTHQYVDKIEGYIGQEKVDAVKAKVGEANFKKGEDALEAQIQSRFK